MSELKLYRFDVLDHRGTVLAEGIGVHAESMPEAEVKARKLLQTGEANIRFKSNDPCHPARKCAICSAPAQQPSAAPVSNDVALPEPDVIAYTTIGKNDAYSQTLTRTYGQLRYETGFEEGKRLAHEQAIAVTHDLMNRQQLSQIQNPSNSDFMESIDSDKFSFADIPAYTADQLRTYGQQCSDAGFNAGLDAAYSTYAPTEDEAWSIYNVQGGWGHEPTAKGLFIDGYRAASPKSAIVALRNLVDELLAGDDEGLIQHSDAMQRAIRALKGVTA